MTLGHKSKLLLQYRGSPSNLFNTETLEKNLLLLPSFPSFAGLPFFSTHYPPAASFSLPCSSSSIFLLFKFHPPPSSPWIQVFFHQYMSSNQNLLSLHSSLLFPQDTKIHNQSLSMLINETSQDRQSAAKAIWQWLTPSVPLKKS